MRLRWSSPTVITFVVLNLILLLGGCGAQHVSAAGRRTPPPPATAAPAEVPDDLGFVEQEPADQEPADQEPVDQEPADREPTDEEPADQEPATGEEQEGEADESEVEEAEPLPPVNLAGLPENQRPAPSDATLRIGVADVDLAAVDPASATTASELVAADLLYDGLTTTIPTTDEVLVLVGELADKWGPVEDDAHWEFILRASTFADGSTITADAVRSSLSRTVSDAPDSDAAALLTPVIGWQAVADGDATLLSGIEDDGPEVVRFRLAIPDGEFPSVLADPRLGIVNLAGETEESSMWYEVALAEDRLSLEHSTYTGLEFDKVELVSYPDEEALADAYATGALDVAVVGSGVDPNLVWKTDISPIPSRPDGSFDVLSVTRE